MNYSLKIQKRNPGKADEDRISGLVPGVIYGPERKPQAISISYVEFEKIYREAGKSNLIDLQVEGEKESAKVLIQNLQYEPVKGKISHVDFRQINMNVEMEVAIHINFINEAPAVKELSGTLVKTTDKLNIRCLPKNLVSEINVDLSVLKTFEETIHVKDIKLPDGIVTTDNPDNVIAKVAPSLTEEQIKAMEESGPKSIEEVEVEKKGKKDEEAEGGETAPAEAPKKEEKK